MYRAYLYSPSAVVLVPIRCRSGAAHLPPTCRSYAAQVPIFTRFGGPSLASVDSGLSQPRSEFDHCWPQCVRETAADIVANLEAGIWQANIVAPASGRHRPQSGRTRAQHRAEVVRSRPKSVASTGPGERHLPASQPSAPNSADAWPHLGQLWSKSPNQSNSGERLPISSFGAASRPSKGLVRRAQEGSSRAAPSRLTLADLEPWLVDSWQMLAELRRVGAKLGRKRAIIWSIQINIAGCWSKLPQIWIHLAELQQPSSLGFGASLAKLDSNSVKPNRRRQGLARFGQESAASKEFAQNEGRSAM